MAGLWETLPASPCSAASDDPAARAASKHNPASPQPPTKSQVLLNTLPATPNNTSSMSLPPMSGPGVPSSPPIAKRARVELSPRTTRPIDMDKPASPDTVSGLNVNSSEDDLVEKRRALLERLRIIENEKAKLKSPPREEEVTIVEASIAPPRPAAQSRRPSGKKASKAAPRANDVIDLEDTSLDIASLAPKKKAQKRKFSARSTASKSIDLDLVELSKRKSSRVRRPRTPNLLDDKPHKVGPIPTCMSKCKRVQFCKKLIMAMLRDENARAFSAPVNELWHEQSIPKYFEIITRPMDLGTIKKQLETTEYIQPISGDVLPYRFDVEHFADDVRLVFRNAMVYNRAGDFIHNRAHSLLEEFEKSLETLPPLPSLNSVARPAPKKKAVPTRAAEKAPAAPRSRPKKSTEPARSSGSLKVKKTRQPKPADDLVDADLDGMSVKELRDRLRYLQRCRVPVMARKPLPKGSGYLSKAALLYSVDMTWQERKKCKEAANKVPESKTESFLALITKNSNLAHEGDAEEVEIDLDRLDNKSFRNIEAFLEQFVPGFKTVRSSSIGREFSDVELLESETQRVREKLASVQAELKKDSGRSGTPAVANKSFFSQGEAQESSSDSSDSSSDDDDSDSDSSDSGDDSD